MNQMRNFVKQIDRMEQQSYGLSLLLDRYTIQASLLEGLFNRAKQGLITTKSLQEIELSLKLVSDFRGRLQKVYDGAYIEELRSDR